MGYEPRIGYADALPALCDAIVAEAAASDRRDAFPVMAGCGWNPFDHAAEDAALPAPGMA